MLPDLVSNPGPLTYEPGALPTVLHGPARDFCVYSVCLCVRAGRGGVRTGQGEVVHAERVGGGGGGGGGQEGTYSEVVNTGRMSKNIAVDSKVSVSSRTIGSLA